MPLLVAAAHGFQSQAVSGCDDRVVSAVLDFMMERLRAYYQDAGIRADVFEAVLARRPTQPKDFDARVRAVEAFRHLPEAESLAAANKRIRNILRKAADTVPEDVDQKYLQEPAERTLAEQMSALGQVVAPLFERREYAEALMRLAALRESVDHYFDTVLVMVDDIPVRCNRLAQLSRLQELFLRVADLSYLQQVD
jgi:glycyl-tRNA synthetase beta chain